MLLHGTNKITCTGIPFCTTYPGFALYYSGAVYVFHHVYSVTLWIKLNSSTGATMGTISQVNTGQVEIKSMKGKQFRNNSYSFQQYHLYHIHLQY
jgi:hypothetical protein